MEITFEVDLKPIQREVKPIGRKREHVEEAPRLTRLLVLAYQIEQAIDEGRANNYAAVARQLGVTRARITQVVSLLLLSPAIQTTVLTQSKWVRQLSERQLRPVAEEPDWLKQQTMFDELLAHAASEALRRRRP